MGIKRINRILNKFFVCLIKGICYLFSTLHIDKVMLWCLIVQENLMLAMTTTSYVLYYSNILILNSVTKVQPNQIWQGHKPREYNQREYNQTCSYTCEYNQTCSYTCEYNQTCSYTCEYNQTCSYTCEYNQTCSYTCEYNQTCSCHFWLGCTLITLFKDVHGFVVYVKHVDDNSVVYHISVFCELKTNLTDVTVNQILSM